VWLGDALKQRWSAALEAAVAGEGRPVFFLQACLALMAVNAAVFHWLPVASHDTRINLLVCAGLVALMWPAARPAWFVPVLYLSLSFGAALVVFIAARTGGVHSPVLLWLCLLPLLALLMGGLRHGFVCLLLAQVLLLIMWRLTAEGYFSAQVPQSRADLWVVSGSTLLCVLTPFVVIMLYDHLHRRRMADLRDGNHALRSTYADLAQAQAHKDDFVAAVGHELRTPMSAILGLNALLREHLAHAPDQLQAVDHIRRSTQQLLVVVNNILDFSQLQAGQLRLHADWADVRSTVHEVMEEYRGRAVLKHLDVQLGIAQDVPQQVHTDHLRFKQVLANLLDNAVRYAPEGGWVRVLVAVREAGLWVEVSDNGPGIDAQLQPHLFSVFTIDKDRNRRNNQGTGLGLSICQQLVGLAGGQIGLRSTKGVGACFWFVWPSTAPHALAAAAPPPSQPLASLHVLVVDDDPINRMVTALQIRQALPQCQVSTVADARQAQQHLRSRVCQVVVLDLYMAGMGGIELTQWIREQPGALQRITVIGLTASTYPQDWERCRQAGMDGVLTKPLDATRIVQLLTRTVAVEAGGAA
jgi:signal transduction histidine kinase/CheY-like chemotaxis protein